MPRLGLVALSLSLAALAVAPAVVRADDAPAKAPAAPPAAQGVVFEAGTPAFADVLAKAAKETKPVFIDFFTDT